MHAPATRLDSRFCLVDTLYWFSPFFLQTTDPGAVSWRIRSNQGRSTKSLYMVKYINPYSIPIRSGIEFTVWSPFLAHNITKENHYWSGYTARITLQLQWEGTLMSFVTVSQPFVLRALRGGISSINATVTRCHENCCYKNLTSLSRQVLAS